MKFDPQPEIIEADDEEYDRDELANYESYQLQSNDMTSSTNMNVDMVKLTNKKRQYLQDHINDKNGTYSYLEDPVEYKKARKRL